MSFSETKSKNYFSRIFVNCDVTHYNWAVTSYVAVRVLVRVYMHDVTSDVWRHQKKIFKVKVQHSEKSGFVTECHFRKQNPENFFIVTILVTSYIEHLKSCYHISKQQGVFYLYQKYFKHVTSSSAEICVGFCFRKWRSVTHPIFGFCFRDLPIWVNLGRKTPDFFENCWYHRNQRSKEQVFTQDHVKRPSNSCVFRPLKFGFIGNWKP